MRVEECQRLFELERSYWWFVGTRNVIERTLRRQLGGREGCRILDAGSGSGIMLDRLHDLGRVVGLDISWEAALFCAGKGHRDVMVGAAEALPFAEEVFDLVLAADVLEHCRDDGQVIGEFHRVLRPQGLLLLTVPAFPVLWSHHDVAVGHHRRYRRRQLEDLLGKHGFLPVKVTYFNFFLFPAFLVARLGQRILRSRDHPPRADYPPLASWLNRVLVTILDLEAWLLRASRLPVGTSLLALAERE